MRARTPVSSSSRKNGGGPGVLIDPIHQVVDLVRGGRRQLARCELRSRVGRHRLSASMCSWASVSPSDPFCEFGPHNGARLSRISEGQEFISSNNGGGRPAYAYGEGG